jgi:hypothetical protein
VNGGISGHIEPDDYALTACTGRGSSVHAVFAAPLGALVSFDTVLVRPTVRDFDNDDTGGGQPSCAAR